MEGPNGFGHFLRRRREECEMILTELVRRMEISIAYLSRMPLDDLFAAARRLPPDLLSRIDHVIAVYRLQAAGSAYDAAGCLISLTVGAWSLCPEPPPCR